MAVMPSTFGETLVIVLKMLMSTRKSVTRRDILPGITSMGMRKEIQETITNKPRKNMISTVRREIQYPQERLLENVHSHVFLGPTKRSLYYY